MRILSPLFDSSAADTPALNSVGQASRAGTSLRRAMKSGGFSMVELVLSLGVLSFAFIGLLALLPAGMNAFHQAVDASVGLQISQRVVDEALQTDFNTFVSKTQAVRYFDDQANELPNKTGAIYHVNVRIQPTVSVPGQTDTNPNLAGITVQVANNPGGKVLSLNDGNLWCADSSVPITSYSTFLAGHYQPQK